MWTSRSEAMANGRLLKIAIDLDASPVSYGEILHRWQAEPVFRSFFIALLADAPFAAFRWETPSLTAATVNRPFEFVLVDSPGLASNPDANVFAGYFSRAADEGVVTFSNLGNDAILIVPCPQGPVSAYGHLGAFIRQAPEPQKHALWAQVGVAMKRRLGTKPVWLSTAGAGVSWMHVRLDDRPKYYAYGPFREPAESRDPRA
jgi:hypothetical protein